jgi:glycosyltransferase involved in cell wall biosynthesis
VNAYLEISSLFEDHWTGIPVVTASLAEHALADNSSGIHWSFLFDTIPLPNQFVQDLLRARSGRKAREQLSELLWSTPPLNWKLAREGVAVFTNIKPERNYFRRESMVIYDLSPILTPQFHHIDSVNHFAYRFAGDVDSSDHFFCISEATRGDLETYLGVDRGKTSLIQMGVDLKWEDVSAAQCAADYGIIEPYVVVVGTLEPRKNGRIVLKYLANNPAFGKRNRIVFLGRDGWLDERQRLMAEINSHGISSDRVVFTGYISEREKIALLYNSKFCIYPSFFEGFGLPVLEAAVLGRSIVCSNTSSMPEVAPSKCFFFDPNSLAEFGWAISAAEEHATQTRVSSSLDDTMTEAEKHNWLSCYNAVKQWVLS